MSEWRSPVNATSDPVPVGSVPPVGRGTPEDVRPGRPQSRYGEPLAAFAAEVVDVPPIGPDEVLIAVMAAGINYNNVWAARGYPVDQVAAHQKAGESTSSVDNAPRRVPGSPAGQGRDGLEISAGSVRVP
jgi:crotonyl-CoA carboxylase/reductase